MGKGEFEVWIWRRVEGESEALFQELEKEWQPKGMGFQQAQMRRRLVMECVPLQDPPHR
jgi:hypothetical protein